MFLHLKAVLNQDELRATLALLEGAPWIDGQGTAGGQARHAKHNRQLAQDCSESRALQKLVLDGLHRHPLFFTAALPRRIFNPLFNRYDGDSNFYGAHIDGAVLRSAATGEWVRSDLSCTVFLSDPGSYEGGELVVEQGQAQRLYKLPAGDAVLYPGSQVHQVRPVLEGTRLASFLWIESMVRNDEQRQLLFDFDMNLLKLRSLHGETPEAIALAGVYHNLLRQWVNT